MKFGSYGLINAHSCLGSRCCKVVWEVVVDNCRLINFQPSASHHPQDECDKELRSLENTFAETCERYDPEASCRTAAKNTIKHSLRYTWQDHLASKVLDDGKTPVFWAGFWPGGKEGIDTREALADFISSVNGFQLANTEWGQAAESKGANNLENCTWDRKKNWWNVASISMARSMAFHHVPKIMIALHKTLHGKYPFYNTVLYRAELLKMGDKMREKSTWNPQFEVHSIAVEGAPPDESGCALASDVKHQLELQAGRPVTVWCRTCTTLRRCRPKQQVEKKEMETKCIEGDCQNGQGTKTWADGDIYQGGYKNGEMDGQGTFTYANGDIYQGGFKNGKMDGQGTYTDANGNKYQGGFKNGKMDGQGTYTSGASGNQFEVWYDDGHLLTKKVKKSWGS